MKLTARIVLICCALLGAFMLPTDAAAQAGEITAAFAKQSKPKPGDNSTPPKDTPPPVPTPPQPAPPNIGLFLPAETCVRRAGDSFQAQLLAFTNGETEIAFADRTMDANGAYYLDTIRNPPMTVETLPDGDRELHFDFTRPAPPATNRGEIRVFGTLRVTADNNFIKSSFLSYERTDGTLRAVATSRVNYTVLRGDPRVHRDCLIGESPVGIK